MLMILLMLELSYAQSTVTEKERDAEDVSVETDGDEHNYRLEFSFGSSLLFVEQPLWNRQIQENQAQVMPVSSVLILGEYLFNPRWSFGTMLNIPTTTKRYIVDDLVVEEYSASSIGLGVAYKPIVKPILNNKVSFRVQTALMAGIAINSLEHRFFPIAVVRPSLATTKGFSMYLGSALSVQVESIALIYGVSQLF